MTTMTDDNITVIENSIQLSDYNVIETDSLQNHPAYSHYLGFAKKVFEKLLRDYSLENRPYQYEYAALMCVRRHNIMGYSMSVGKTFCTLIAIATLFPNLSTMRRGAVHVVLPSLLASIRWIEDIKRIESLKDYWQIVRTEEELLACDKPIIFYLQDFPKQRARKAPKSRPHISKLLSSLFKPALMVVDECHGVKSNTARRVHLMKVRQRARRSIGLSGTLSDGNLNNIFNICEFIYQKHWPFTSAQTFTKIYGSKEKLSSNYLYGARKEGPEKFLQNLSKTKVAEFYSLSRKFIHRVRLDEPQVIKFLKIPKQVIHVHKLEATATQKLIYSDYLTGYQDTLNRILTGEIKNIAEALKLLYPFINLANSPNLGLTNVKTPHSVDIETEKIQKVKEICRDSKGKILIFYTYLNSGRFLQQYLQKDFGSQVVRLYATDKHCVPSSLTPEQREDIVNKFQYDDSVKIGIFSINLASEAIDLTSASDVVYYCIPWSSIKIQQSLSRAIRPGNKNAEVNTHFLYQSGMIDEHQTILAMEKIKNSNLLMDFEVTDQDTTDFSPREVIRQLLGR